MTTIKFPALFFLESAPFHLVSGHYIVQEITCYDTYLTDTSTRVGSIRGNNVPVGRNNEIIDSGEFNLLS